MLINKFQQLGISLNFGNSNPIKTKFDYCMLISTGADLCYNNKKLIGSAQCRKNGYILQHGSILYDYDKELLEKIFKEKVNTENITTIKEINPNLTKEEIINTLGG
jgi:lipoate-protein ligase A